MMSHDPGAWKKKRIRSLTEILGHWHDEFAMRLS